MSAALLSPTWISDMETGAVSELVPLEFLAVLLRHSLYGFLRRAPVTVADFPLARMIFVGFMEATSLAW